jgi:starvation-inducible outer membrane lipoprotein
MNTRTRGIVLLISIGLSACAPSTVFSPEVLEGVDPNFNFGRWRMLPNQAEEKKIQLGGRIIYGEMKGDHATIVVAQLPIVEHPAYGPNDTGRSGGDFAITYAGKVEPSFLQRGNRIMVVGVTHGPKVVAINDLPKSLPTVQAICIHLWKTGGRDIADFPSYGAGYESLEVETLCSGRP